MNEKVAILDLVLSAINALGALAAIWWHCKRDIAKRAIQDARLDALEKRVSK